MKCCGNEAHAVSLAGQAFGAGPRGRRLLETVPTRRRSRGRHFLVILFFLAATVFSCRTPLNFLAAFLPAAGFFSAMNSPEALLRLVHAVAPPSAVAAG